MYINTPLKLKLKNTIDAKIINSQEAKILFETCLEWHEMNQKVAISSHMAFTFFSQRYGFIWFIFQPPSE